jgi:hypothetical protein
MVKSKFITPRHTPLILKSCAISAYFSTKNKLTVCIASKFTLTPAMMVNSGSYVRTVVDGCTANAPIMIRQSILTSNASDAKSISLCRMKFRTIMHQ